VNSVARVCVVGASGFAGALAASILWSHPRVELAAVTARREVGRRLDDLFPRYRVPLTYEPFDPSRLGELDAALVSYPHGASAPVVAALRAQGLRVVDLSADFRLHDLDAYGTWYGEHGAPELLAEAVFGLTELHRSAIAGAGLVANPGCYSTAAVLALAPLARAGLIEEGVIDAKSGVSGAGREATDTTHFVNISENVNAYGVQGHRHAPEIDQELLALGCAEKITFTPHLLPIDQGLLASCYVTPTRDLEAEELRALFAEAYDGERFIELTDEPPGVRDVRDTNICRIHATVEPRTGRVLVFCAIDNLWKGAAGQAVQNLNLMLDFDEGEGLVG
jgi:N-acetyl-gamma-glutamyl-phosphate reductase